jgi:hypothetical protein
MRAGVSMIPGVADFSLTFLGTGSSVGVPVIGLPVGEPAQPAAAGLSAGKLGSKSTSFSRLPVRPPAVARALRPISCSHCSLQYAMKPQPRRTGCVHCARPDQWGGVVRPLGRAALSRMAPAPLALLNVGTPANIRTRGFHRGASGRPWSSRTAALLGGHLQKP